MTRLDLRHRIALDINEVLQRDVRRNHPLEQLFWECTLRCNLTCRHCGSDCKADYNPSGKLPVTFYASTADLPDFLDYSMDNRTYRYFRGKPQYAFGYGLSYTTFAYGTGKLNKRSMKKDGKVTLTVPVTNTGSLAGAETVQVYVQAIDNPDAPIKALQGFDKLQLAPGATKKASITLDGEAFSFYNADVDGLAVRPGKYRILYGSSSRDEDLQALDFQVL